MNFKSLIVVGLSIATMGLSLPAHAGDTATSVILNQKAVVTGDNNVTGQSDSTTIRNRSVGTRRASNNTGTIINKSQIADVEGFGNITGQDSNTTIDNDSRTRRPRRVRY